MAVPGTRQIAGKPMSEARSFPIQGGNRHAHSREAGKVNEAVYMRAYEVYKYCYGEQKAMIEGHCRGGFGKGELAAFLYASGFPRVEWKQRVDEALAGMDI